MSFRYYLHNVTMPNSTTPVLNYGSPNVLSVFVDALTEQEGAQHRHMQHDPPAYYAFPLSLTSSV